VFYKKNVEVLTLFLRLVNIRHQPVIKKSILHRNIYINIHIHIPLLNIKHYRKQEADRE